MTPRRIGVCPPAAYHEGSRLWSALEQLGGVSFDPRREDEPAGLDAAVVVGGADARGFAREGARTLCAGPGAETAARAITLAESPRVDARLRGLSLPESHAGAAFSAQTGEEVLAACPDGAHWTARDEGGARVDRVSTLPPLDLGPEEPLSGRLSGHRFLGLLPLLQLVRETAGERAWTPPPMRAAFLIDDPNLHWPSYGHARFADIARHGDRHGHHLAIAMIPLDGWVTHPGARRLFRDRPDRLSVVMHGNDHLKHELDHGDPEDLRRRLSQALRRARRFTERSGVPVGRVMVPPHSRLGRAALAEMARVGFDACCVAHPVDWLRAAAPHHPMVGWGSAEWFDSALPVLPRFPLDTSRQDLALAACRDQPLVLYGHHTDLAPGLDALARATERVASVGTVEWTSLTTIAHGSAQHRREGGTLHVRLFSRRTRILVPEGVEEVIAERPAGPRETGERALPERGGTALLRSSDGALVSDPIPVSGLADLEVTLVSDDALDPDAVPAPRASAWPGLRRALTEGRDRLAPLVRRVRP